MPAQADLVEHVPALARVLQDPAKPLAERFRALFTLRNINGASAVDAIVGAFGDESALLKHECAYCLGQMQDVHAVTPLIAVLEDDVQDVMVRHEAAEALGALGDDAALDSLRRHKDSPIVEIAETCEIALDLIAWKQQQATAEASGEPNPYASVDPAPAAPQATVAELKAQYLDTALTLFHRYRALFALRNIGDSEAVEAIVEGLNDASALFRHEVAYVLGQMQHPASVEGLKARLQDGDENYMVRHECAEALGSIAHDDCLPVLQAFAEDSERVVKESCVVALDMHAHERSGAFQYADGVTQVAEASS